MVGLEELIAREIEQYLAVAYVAAGVSKVGVA